jgi:hypothetical protein
MTQAAAMRYIVGYFALMLGLGGISMLGAGRAEGFLFLLLSAALIYLLVRMQRARRRDRRYGNYGEAIEGYERRFSDAERSLEAKLPQDALGSPALVELLSAYEHDVDSADAIRKQYAQLRERFVEWRDQFERMRALDEAGAVGLPDRFAEQYDQLDKQLSQLTADVKKLESRAAQVGKETDDPLDQIARAALKLEQVKSACTHRFAGKIPQELASQLAAADDKLGQARAAIAKGAERPLDATRLSQEASALAASVEGRATELAELPTEIDGKCVRLEAEISDAKAKLEAAAENYSPSCLLEIQGCGAEAEESVQRARALAAEKAASGADVRLAQAKEALGRAEVLVRRIEDHLATLEQAALEARHDIEQAELDADRAWASVTASSKSAEETERVERVASRARELAAQARTEIEQPRPDWFRATALAKRASQMAQELGAPRSQSPVPAESSRPDVEAARARAEAALTDVRPLVTEADGLLTEDNMARVCLERGQEAYDKAVAVQTRLAVADDPDAAAQTAIDGFHVAEESAAAAHEHAIGLRARDGTRPSGKTAARLLWGAIGGALAPD